MLPSPSSNTRSHGTTTEPVSPSKSASASKDAAATSSKKSKKVAESPPRRSIRQALIGSPDATAQLTAGKPSPSDMRSRVDTNPFGTWAGQASTRVHGPKSALEESVVRNSTPLPKEDDTEAGAVKDDTKAESVPTEVAPDYDEAKGKSANPTTPQVDKKLNLDHYAQSPVHSYMMNLKECYEYRDRTCAKMKREIHPTMIIALAIFYIDGNDNLTVCMPNANHNAFHKKTAGEILLGILSDSIPCRRLGSQSNELGNDMSALLTYDDGSEQVRSLL